MTAVLVEYPKSEPVTLAMARMHLRISHAHENELISHLIQSARQQVEQMTGRALINQLWRLYIEDVPQSGRITLPKAPVSQITSITAYDGAGYPVLIDQDKWRSKLNANPPALQLLPLAEIKAKAQNGLEVDFIAGYGESAESVPEALKTAILLLVGFWYEHRTGAHTGKLTDLLPHGLDHALSPFKVLRL
ncbi:head-tail connector protein [Polycladidibacter stylochi]|uniref:head-tail connector protein n=1 Tax=Polycladidibacter stylochi TaxID=1807766 RepID=UPI0008358C78|nr:head-tail connector protein [Pseudovibrio stylochi]